jgi:hypothetical protein
MRGVKAFHAVDGTPKALQARRRKDRFILSAFNIGVVVFFVLVYFLSLLGFAL